MQSQDSLEWPLSMFGRVTYCADKITRQLDKVHGAHIFCSYLTDVFKLFILLYEISLGNVSDG